MARPSYRELLAISSVLLAVVEATWAYYPAPSPGPLLAAAGLLAVYAAATSVGDGPSTSVLLTATAAIALLSPVLPASLVIVPVAASLALVASPVGGRRALLALASAVAFTSGYPFLPLLAAAGFLAAEWRVHRVHALLLPAGYVISSIAGYLGMPVVAASFALASTAALAAYSGRGLTTCPFRTDRPMTSAGLAALAALALASKFVPSRVLIAASAAALYVLAAGLLAPTFVGSSERGLSVAPMPVAQ